MTKDLKILDKCQVSKNNFKYEFTDKEHNKYIWVTSKEYWFEKFEWWEVTFEEKYKENEYTIIGNCRAKKHRGNENEME